MAVYGCGVSRCISAVFSAENKTRYLVGTQKLRESNEIHLIEYDAENEAIRCVNIYGHKHELWDLAPGNGENNNKLFTTYNTGVDYEASLWEIPSEEDKNAHASGTLKHLGQLDPILVQAPVRCVLWSPHESALALSVDDEALRTWKLDDSDIKSVGSSESGSDANALRWSLAGAVWNPHDPNMVSCWAGQGFTLWDLRTMKPSACVDAAHSMPVRDVDFNPQQSHYLASCGDDSKVKFWDMRCLAEISKSTKSRGSQSAVLEYSPHKHWIWKVKFNPTHDRLVLTTSSDTDVCLSRVLSLSSTGDAFSDSLASPTSSGVGGASNEPADEIVEKFTAHEDTVYGAAWSQVDPWVFATVSYDGRATINSVPRAEKYKILL